MTHQEAYRKLDEVRDEFDAVRLTLAHALHGYQNKTDLWRNLGKVTLHDLEVSVDNLPITYFLRLFAEFEGILRDYWVNGRGRSTSPRMMDLMNSIAAYCFIGNDDLADAHEVREYRNHVIHQHLQDPRFDFQTCRS